MESLPRPPSELDELKIIVKDLTGTLLLHQKEMEKNQATIADLTARVEKLTLEKKELTVDQNTVDKKVESSRAPTKPKAHSKKAILCLTYKAKLEGTKIQHAESPEGEKRIDIGKARLASVDGFCEETQTVYEFHGDHWHGNPRTKDPKTNPGNIGGTFGEIYEQTIEKENRIKARYHLVTDWEDEFDALGITEEYIKQMPEVKVHPPLNWFLELKIHTQPSSPKISLVGLFSLKSDTLLTTDILKGLHSFLFEYRQVPIDDLINVLSTWLNFEVRTTDRTALEAQTYAVWEEYVYNWGRRPDLYGFDSLDVICVPGLNPITGFFKIYRQRKIPVENLEELKTINLKDRKTTVAVLTTYLRDKLFCRVGHCLKPDLVEKFLEYKDHYIERKGKHPIPLCCRSKTKKVK